MTELPEPGIPRQSRRTAAFLMFALYLLGFTFLLAGSKGRNPFLFLLGVFGLYWGFRFGRIWRRWS